MNKQNYFQVKALSWSAIKRNNKPYPGGIGFLDAIKVGSYFDALATNPDFIFQESMYWNESEMYWEGLDMDLYKKAKDMYISLCSSNVWKQFLEQKPTFQHEGFGTKIVNGIEINVKCKPDGYVPNILIMELKSTKETTSEGFKKAMRALGYNGGGVWYLDICPANTFLCIGVSKTFPHEVFSFEFEKHSEVYFALSAKIENKLSKMENLEIYK